MSLYKQFKTNPDIEKSGVFLQYGTTEDGRPIQIKVARAGGSNTKFTKLMEQRAKPFRRQIQAGTADSKQMEKLVREVYAQSVVLGWENVQDENGNDMPFTVENCIKLFEDLPDLYTDLVQQSQEAALFKAELLKADAGN